MKKWILIGWGCVYYMALQAQTDSAFAFVHYTFTHMDDTTQPHFLNVRDMRLMLGKKMSCYVDYGQMAAIYRMMNDPNTNADAVADSRQLLMRSGIFKEPAKNLLTFVAPAGLSTYLIEETIPEMRWEMTQDTRDIKGYPCQKATCLFRGRNYEAWFCTQLPYNNGPWKLGGLPGLILEAYDVNKDVMFSFVSFETAGDYPVFSVPKGMTKTTDKAYRQYIEAMNKDTRAMLGSVKASGGKVLMGTPTARAGSGPPRRQKILNNPLEKTNTDNR
jgi:GLPGLI family protein